MRFRVLFYLIWLYYTYVIKKPLAQGVFQETRQNRLLIDLMHMRQVFMSVVNCPWLAGQCKDRSF